MKVKLFDYEHELDLENAINEFLSNLDKATIIDIKYSVSHFSFNSEQLFSFSALIIYKEK